MAPTKVSHTVVIYAVRVNQDKSHQVLLYRPTQSQAGQTQVYTKERQKGHTLAQRANFLIKHWNQFAVMNVCFVRLMVFQCPVCMRCSLLYLLDFICQCKYQQQAAQSWKFNFRQRRASLKGPANKHLYISSAGKSSRPIDFPPFKRALFMTNNRAAAADG